SLSYAVSITNNSTPMCGASTFGVTGLVPTGWAGTVSTPSLTLSPGTSGQTTFTVTSAANAAVGIYTPKVSVSDAAAAHASSNSSVYSVLDGTSPTAPANLVTSTNTKQKQVQLSWSTSTDNVAVVAYRVWRNGVVIGTPAATSWVDAGYSSGA